MKSRVLKVKQTLELVPTAPFNFDATLHKPDHFPAADTTWEPGTRDHTFDISPRVTYNRAVDAWYCRVQTHR